MVPSSESWSIDGDRTNLKTGRSPFVKINDAGRAADVDEDDVVVAQFPPTIAANDADDELYGIVVGLAGGRFSLINSIRIGGTSCLIDTRLSVFMLPECFKMESRRDIIGDEAIDGHALTDMYA